MLVCVTDDGDVVELEEAGARECFPNVADARRPRARRPVRPAPVESLRGQCNPPGLELGESGFGHAATRNPVSVLSVPLCSLYTNGFPLTAP